MWQQLVDDKHESFNPFWRPDQTMNKSERIGGIDLFKVDLRGTNLINASLCKAHLVEAKLDDANLANADLSGADLSGSELINARLCGADFRSAVLQYANLRRCLATDIKLWETLRAGWTIEGIQCKRVYWDEDAEIVTEYEPGEFEALYYEQATIELLYPGGISSFEVSTLPALLHRLASKHPDTNIRLKTIEAAGGGTKVTINLGDANEEIRAAIESEAAQVLQAQLVLRGDEVRRLQFERDFFQGQYDRINNALLAAVAPQVHFYAPVHTTVELHQTFNDNTALLQLIDKLLTRNIELTATQSAEVQEAKTELQKPDPQKTRLTRFYDFLKTLPKEAILKGAGKLGEKATEIDWSNLLQQLERYIHHLS